MKRQAKENLKSLGIQFGKTYYASFPKLEIIIEELNRESMDESWKKMQNLSNDK